MGATDKGAGDTPVTLIAVEPIMCGGKRTEPGEPFSCPPAVADELLAMGHAKPALDAEAEAKAQAEAEAKAQAEAEAKAQAEAEAKAKPKGRGAP